MAEESYLKSLAVLALKREGYAIKSDQVGYGTFDGRACQGQSLKTLGTMAVWVDLPSGVRRSWKGTRVQIEEQLKKATEGR